MNHHPLRTSRRKGTVAVLMAILAVPLLGMVAFAVDMAWITSTQANLQAAADAAALAGVQQLMGGFVAFNSPLATGQAAIVSQAEATAKTYARNFAGYNGAGGVASLTLNDADIVFGYTTSSGSYSVASGSSVYPNTCTVTVRRDSSANGALTLFFAPVLGVQCSTLTATSTAVIYTGTSVTSFNSAAGINGALLPLALDVNAWTTFYATGVSPDGLTHLGTNGLPQMQVYPSPGNAPGSFGLLDVGMPSNAIPSFASWITSGPSPGDLQYLNTNNLVPVSASSPQPWPGGPGMKSALKRDFTGVEGQSRLIPVFQPVSTNPYQAAAGNGSNTTYNIVGFVGVTITQASGYGRNMNISVQPAATLDPTVIYNTSTVVPAGEGSSPTTTFSLPKLTQ